MAVSEPFLVAAVEFSPGNESLEANVAGAVAMAREAAAAGAKLIALPEESTSGYDFDAPILPRPFLDTIPGAMTDAMAEVTREYGCYIAVGISESDPDTSLLYNSAALIGPDGLVGRYRKNGLNPQDQVYFAPGNSGYPVFDTEYGRVCMIICYDDTYWEPARLSALKGADVVMYPCNAARGLTGSGKVMPGWHTTIAATQEMCAWNGLAVLTTDHNNSMMVPSGKFGIYSPGAAAIWLPTGEKAASAPVEPATVPADRQGVIIYAELDPATFDNDQKRTFAWRRPDLYGDLALFRAPLDGNASTESHRVRAAAVQVVQTAGDRDACAAAIDAEVTPLAGEVDLVVLPAFTFTGPPGDAAALAEPADGPTQAKAGEMAKRLRAHVVASHVERDDDALYHRAILVGPDGSLVGAYRQTHIDPERSSWATGGDDFPVFPTSIGRIGLLLCEDARFPEAAGMMAVRRADIIALPTWWDGSYGGPVLEDPALFVTPYPTNAMSMWYAMAKMSQAYTVVANAVGGGAAGDSGVFTINPVDSEEVAVTVSGDAAGAAQLEFQTLGDPSFWMNQAQLIVGRRPDLAAPVAFPTDSVAFARWRDTPGYDISAWAAYNQ